MNMRNKVHLRFDSNDSHSRVTLFMRGANCGQLTFRPEEALWFANILTSGCSALRLGFVGSGEPPSPVDEEINKCARELDRKGE